MGSASFPPSPSNYNNLQHLKEGNVNDELGINKDDIWFETKECDGFDSLVSEYNVDHDIEKIEPVVEDQNRSPPGCCVVTAMTTPINPQNYEGKSENRKPNTPLSSACLEFLRSYGRLFQKPKVEKWSSLSSSSTKLSVGEILKLAGERYIQFFKRRIDGFSMFIHPYGSALSGLSIDEMRDVELVHLLLAAGEGVSSRQYHLASTFISRCQSMTSDSGNPVQRLGFHFAEALKERIDRETGQFIGVSEERLDRCRQSMALSSNPAALASHQGLPFSQVMQFAGMETIIENVKTARKIHLIDLNIRSGVQWTIVMQALADRHADCPRLELVKLTAVGVMERDTMDECGKRLQSLADSLALPFSFKTVFLKDFIHVEAEEVVAVLANTVLRTMIPRPDCLDGLMRGIRGLRPAVMVVAEVEANHNSPSFISRFLEALFFFGAYFDCLEDCLDRDDPSRKTMEGLHFGEGIRNVLAAEGEERFNRSVKIDVWRTYFSRFGMLEIQLSDSSLIQANLVRKRFANGSCCTLDRSGKGLIIGWKGTPMHSVTSWKFS